MDAVDLRPEVVNLVTGDDIQVIPSEEAQIGNILLVRPGDRIPLDGIVIEGNSRNRHFSDHRRACTGCCK